MDAASRIGFGCASFFALAALLLLFQPVFLSIYDESIILTGALQVMRGETPGVDFYTVYGPLQFYVVSLLLELFEGNVFAIRVLYACTLGVPIALLALLLSPWRSWFELWLSLAYAMLMVVACSLYASSGYPNHSLPLVCVGILYLKRAELESKHPGYFIAAQSLLLACVLLLRPTIGMVLMLAMAAALPFEAADAGGVGFRRLVASAKRLTASIVLAAVWVAIVDRASGGAFSGVLDIIVTIQSDIYPVMRSLPFPNPLDRSSAIRWESTVSAYAPLMSIAGGGLVYLIVLAGRIRMSAPDRMTLLWLLILSCLLYSLALLRTDGAHLLPSIMFSSLLGAFLVRHFSSTSRRGASSLARDAAVLALLLSITATGVFAFALDRTAIRPTLATDCRWSEVPMSRQACLRVSDQESQVLDYLSSHLRTGERVFSANSRHDRIFINNLSYYALSGHLPITFWAHMDPGVQTTEAVQREIIDELDTHARTYGRSIVIVEQALLRDEPNRSTESSGVHLLDTYLAGCREVFASGTAVVRECEAISGETETPTRTRKPDAERPVK